MCGYKCAAIPLIAVLSYHGNNPYDKLKVTGFNLKFIFIKFYSVNVVVIVVALFFLFFFIFNVNMIKLNV